MSKKFIYLLMAIMTVFETNIYASDIDYKIAIAEKNILEAGTIEVDYNSEMIVNSDLLDSAVWAAIEKKKEYAESDEQKYKDLNIDIFVALKNTPKKFSIAVAKDLNGYSDFVDNIIINAEGLYCFVSLSEFLAKEDNMDLIDINIADENNIIARYRGTAETDMIKKMLTGIFVFITAYIFIFIFLVIKKLEFREGVSIKKIYFAFGTAAVLCVASICLVCFVDDKDFATERLLKLDEKNNAVFSVDFGNGLYDNRINGIYVGVPLYDETYDKKLVSAFRKSNEINEADKILGGKYIESIEIFKFPVAETGKYYLKNNSISFNDVSKANAELYEAVSVLAAKNIISGKSDEIFGTNDTLTRAEAITMLCKMLNLDETKNSDEKFDDISVSDWYYSYAMAGKGYGMLSGYEDNTFRSNNEITRQEFTAVIGQILNNKYGYKLPDEFSNLYKYSDFEDISVWARNYISLAEGEGINIWNSSYFPHDPITRGEAVMMLYRLYGIID